VRTARRKNVWPGFGSPSRKAEGRAGSGAACLRLGTDGPEALNFSLHPELLDFVEHQETCSWFSLQPRQSHASRSTPDRRNARRRKRRRQACPSGHGLFGERCLPDLPRPARTWNTGKGLRSALVKVSSISFERFMPRNVETRSRSILLMTE